MGLFGTTNLPPPSFLWCQFGAIRHHTWCRIASIWHHTNEGGEGDVVPNSLDLAPHKYLRGDYNPPLTPTPFLGVGHPLLNELGRKGVGYIFLRGGSNYGPLLTAKLK